ncbi:MAG: DedA family protein [Candidatus Shapirobacteria bacterium]|nr:DedA family protein [Candidatus Shapirobacteria bacterium]
MVKTILGFILHVDKNLLILTTEYGAWIYGILFVVIFVETGLVVMPFLPGDSLLFAAGALASMGSLNIFYLWLLTGMAAVLGDTANYEIGRLIGKKAFEPEREIKIFGLKVKLAKIFKPEYLKKTEAFYDKYGGKAIILARFVPIVRTFAPFVAGVGSMSYKKFISYNFVGGWLWVSLFLMAGYLFSNIPFVKENFELVAIGIVLVSVVPIIVEIIKSKVKKSK